jgi:hypothetical protein
VSNRTSPDATTFANEAAHAKIQVNILIIPNMLGSRFSSDETSPVMTGNFFLHGAILLKQNRLVLAVQSALQKFFHSHLTQITSTSHTVPSHRGAARDRHGRGAGCGGRGLRIDEGA